MGSDARLVRGAAQKELVKAFESLCGRHGRWEVWADWITMSACSISCAVDAAHKEAREKLYQTTRAKYTEAEMQKPAEIKPAEAAPRPAAPTKPKKEPAAKPVPRPKKAKEDKPKQDDGIMQLSLWG